MNEKAQEIRNILNQIVAEYEPESRIVKKADKIIKTFQYYESCLNRSANFDSFKKKIGKPPRVLFPIEYEAKIINQYYGILQYDLLKHYQQKRTPAVIKGLIDALLETAKQQAHKEFDRIKTICENSELEKDPYTGTIQKRKTRIGA